MFLRYERQRRRMFVCLVGCRKVGQRVRPYRLGYLGSITFGGPVSTADGLRFWTAFDGRWRAVADRHPDRISAGDEAWVRDRIAERIAPPSTPDELRLLSKAIVQRDVVAAFDGGADAMMQAARRL
jgi:hypothetical protein